MNASGTARLFLALLPTPAQRQDLQAHVAAWRWPPKASVYAPADWHLTLHFLGAVPCSRLPELRAGLTWPLPALQLQFGEPVLWPQGLAVLLPRAMAPALQALHGGLAGRLHALGLQTDPRPYRPHVTLARRAAGAVPPAAPDWVWTVTGYALMESSGRPEARYRVLQRYGDGEFVGIGSA